MANEKRLIDANKLKARFKLRIDWLAKDVHDEYTTGLFHGAETDVELIDEIPTVDAVEVVHGRWEEWWPGDCSMIMTGEEMLYHCSVCSAKYADVEGMRYCPNCGALMDGRSNTTEPTHMEQELRKHADYWIRKFEEAAYGSRGEQTDERKTD